MSPDWMSRAACRGMDPALFFPPKRGTPISPTARVTCAGCPVSAECLDHALVEHERDGLWGGTTDRERRRLWQTDKRRRCWRCRDVFHAARQHDRFCSTECRAANRAETEARQLRSSA